MEPVSAALGLIQFAPTIARWIFGKEGEEVATKAVSIAQAVAGVEDPAAAAERLRVDSAARVEFQRLWNQHELAMYEAKTERLKVELQDVHSARRMQVQTRSRVPAWMGAVILVGFFATVGFVLSGRVGLTGEQGVLVGTIVGYVSAKADQVVAFFFGSSSGSQSKDGTIARLTGGGK
ncbi:MAG TPA: hypothetical protein VEB20_03230 [Azospirillaceae bacterium]|nr:hypothetical protein [Azospirillaceae bacterium]